MAKGRDHLESILYFVLSSDDWSVLGKRTSFPGTTVAFGSHVAAHSKGKSDGFREAHSFLSQADWESIADSSVNWIKRWPHKQFIDQSLVHWLHLDDFSLWWQLEGILYYAGLGGDYGGLYSAVKLATLVQRIIEQERPDKVCFVDRGDLQSRTMKHLLDALGVAHQAVGMRRNLSAFKQHLASGIKTGPFHWLWQLWLYLGHRWRAWAYWIGQLRHRREEPGTLRVVLVSEQGKGVRSYVHPRSGEVRHGDFYFAGIEETLLKDDEVQVIELQLKVPVVGATSWIEDLRCIVDRDRDYVPIEAFEDLAQVSKSVTVHKRLRRVWDVLCKDAAFRKALVFGGVDLFPILRDQFKAVFLHNGVMQWSRTQSYRDALRGLAPDVVMMNRHNPAMVDACKLEHVPLVEMEHGTWSRFPAVLLRYYQHWEAGSDVLARPLPSTIAVWGPYMRDLLKRWHYPESHIVVTGYPPYDRLSQLDAAHVGRFAEGLGLDPAKRTIVYMTGNPWMELYQTPQEQVETARALMQAVETLPTLQLVIKVHQYDNVDLYRQLQNELCAESYSFVLQRCDTTLLIAASDAVIAKGSSTLLEAAIADKPVIIVNFSNKPDMFDFKEYGIGPYLDDSTEIALALKAVLFDEEARRRMAEARARFVDEWANGADGNASKRLAGLLKRLAREHSA